MTADQSAPFPDGLTQQERAAIRDALGFDWEPVPGYVPSVDESLADLYAVVAQIIKARMSSKENAMNNPPTFNPELQPGNPGYEPGQTKHFSDQTSQEREWTRRLQSVIPGEHKAAWEEMKAAGQWWPGRDDISQNDYCLSCSHPWSYHETTSHACSMPLTNSGNVVGLYDKREKSCGCRDVAPQ